MHCPNVTSPEVVAKIVHLPPPLPLRAVEDRDVPAALPRRADQPLRRLAGPRAPGHEPPAGLAMLQAPPTTLEALREAAPRAPAADRRQVHSSPSRQDPRAASATTSTRRSMTAPVCGCCGSTPVRTRKPRSNSLTTPRPGCLRHRTGPDRQRRGVPVRLPLAPARPRHRPPLHPAGDPRLNGKVERSHRIDTAEFYRLLEGAVIDDAGLFNDKLREWGTTTTTTDPTAALTARHPTRDCYKRQPSPSPTNVSSTSSGD